MGSVASQDGDVTVVIPTWNRARLLTETLRSIGEQSMPPREVIVADDGSTDDTTTVVQRFGARHLLNPDGSWGAAGARNAGIEAAQTEYVAFIDSDDLYRPRALQRLREALGDRPGAPFAFGRGLAVHRTGDRWVSEGIIAPHRWRPESFLCDLFVRNPVPSGGALVRRAAAEAHGGFSSAIEFSEDHLFWLTLAREAMPVHLPEIVCVYRRHAGGRHPASLTADSYETIASVATDDPRLAACLPRRRGIELCERALDAAHGREPRAAWLALRQLARGPQRVTMVRAADEFLRHRRRAAQDGAALLAGDDDLRDWLASYR